PEQLHERRDGRARRRGVIVIDLPQNPRTGSEPPRARLSRARCLVTGGSRSLGRALCLALARAGARVAFTYQRHTPEAEETRAALERLDCETRVYQGTVSDGDHARKVVADLVATWNGVDVLINN